jgi:hypothetical protein
MQPHSLKKLFFMNQDRGDETQTGYAPSGAIAGGEREAKPTKTDRATQILLGIVYSRHKQVGNPYTMINPGMAFLHDVSRPEEVFKPEGAGTTVVQNRMARGEFSARVAPLRSSNEGRIFGLSMGWRSRK